MSRAYTHFRLCFEVTDFALAVGGGAR